MAKIRLSVGVDDSHLQRMGEVAKAARHAGMEVEQQLGDLGVLTGSIDEEKLDALRRIPGVAHVERERDVRIPPPGSPVQ
jgi:hypothetical protein